MSGEQVTMAKALNSALRKALEDDPKVLIMGEDVGRLGGVFRITDGLQKDFGEAQGKAWLAFGITTVRSPGGTPYEAVEDREAVDAGVRTGPRIFSTGYLMEWQRSYYKMSVAVQNERHLEMELARAKSKLRGTLALGLETSDQRMERLALNEMYFGRQVTLAELAGRLDAVTNDQIVALATRLFTPDACALVLLGDMRGHRIDDGILGGLVA